MIKRECSGCTECCKGRVTGEVFGRKFYPGMPCHFLKKDGCGIHTIRPIMCREWKCGWLDDDGSIFPEWFKPEHSKVIVKREKWGERDDQYFYRFMECDVKLDSSILNWVFQNLISKDIAVAIQINGYYTFYGPPEFTKHINDASKTEKAK